MAQSSPMRSEPSTAKVSIPELPGTLPREALFDRLDTARGLPLVWVTAPAGAGKTTLAASYARARPLTVLWHHLDGGDADPASFFHYLSAAARQAQPRKKLHLPEFTPQYLGGMGTFTRRFFEELCARLTLPAMVVFDDFHEVSGSSLGTLLSEAVEAVPAGVTVLVLSRTDPPPALARLRAGRRMAQLGWDDLRLSETETATMAALARGGDAGDIAPEAAHNLYRRTGGWAAGVVLLADDPNANGDGAALEPGSASQQAVFDYFAHEVYERFDQRVRDVLVRCALPPRISHKAATALCGGAKAGTVLARLADSGFFTYRHSERPVSYQFHPLFRQFLLERAESTLSVAERSLLRMRAADLLGAEGAYEDAAACLMAAGDAARLAALVKTRAPGLAAQGRLATVHTWLDALPDDAVSTDPWLAYWSGACRALADPVASRAFQERAFDLFAQADDLNGQFLAWAGFAETFLFLWRDFDALDPWMERLQSLSGRADELPPETQLRMAATLMFPVSWRFPGHPLMDEWVTRAERLFDQLPNPTLRALLSSVLVLRFGWSGHLYRMERLIDATREAVHGGQVDPATAATWRVAEAEFHWMHGRYEDAVDTANEGLRIAREHGAVGQLHLIHAFAAYPEMAMGHLKQAAAHVDECKRLSPPEMQVQHGHALYLQAWHRLLAGDLPGAVTGAQKSREVNAAAGAPFPVAACHSLLAQTLPELDETGAAFEHLKQLGEIATDTGFPLLKYHHRLISAWFHLRAGRHDACHVEMRKAFSLGMRMGLAGMQPMRPEVMADLCAEALCHRIDPDYARKVISTCRLQPPGLEATPENWPWPVRVSTLGHFSVVVDDQLLPSSHKPKKKTLELLRALIVSGPEGAPNTRLCHRLWPDAEGDTASQSLRTAVHRLRAVIGHDGVIAEQGWVHLNRNTVWVDAWMVDHLLTGLASPREHPAPLPLAERILRLYRGHFLSGDVNSPWEISYSDRLSDRLRRLMSNLPTHGDPERLTALLEQVLDVEPAAERVARALMQCHIQRGRAGEVEGVYRRFKTALRRSGGRTPSAATEALVRSAGHGHSE
ncbi:MAG: hypothetical protein OEY97_09520 [Nitrospirota bacterium]|nr:hypothetical protein [Nitrospirota bacterium]